jgi:hypothetical protein
MVVYICYDRYEHNEWFNVFEVNTDRDESYRKCKETHLPDFICYGPDDCHSFQLVGVEMTKTRFKKLLDWVGQFGSCEGTEKDREFYDFMCDLYEGTEQYSKVVEELVFTDGCSDFYEVVQYYGQMKGIDPEDYEDEEDELQSELCHDDDLCLKVVKEYVDSTY